jgi:sulfite reductase (NADPH) flavoprotein alpha-component
MAQIESGSIAIAGSQIHARHRSTDALPGDHISFGKRFQRVVITIHRWIGIGVCIMVMTWFISGLVLAYVPFPKMSAVEKLKYLRPINWNLVQVTPAQSLAAAHLAVFPREMRLEMSSGRPVYRIETWDRTNLTVAADTDEPLSGVSGDQALAIVRTQLSAPEATIKAERVDSDQWTMTGYWNHERPFHVIALNDAAGSEFHVSVRTGEIVLGTTRTQRLLNWVGAIPHWLYFESIRRYTHTGLWAWLIYIVSGAAILVSISGLWIGISRMRLRGRYTNGSWTPFTGWMKWHHVTGILGGVTLALWLISGFWTMYPGGILEQREIESSEYQRYAGSSATTFPFGALDSLQKSGSEAARVTFRYIGGQPYAVLELASAKPKIVDALTGTTVLLSAAQLAQAAGSMLPDSKVVSTTYLEHSDEYWHSAYFKKKLPVLRVALNDPMATWFHIDPESGEVVGILDRIGRVDRWTVVAIHDVDWNWLLTRRPLWDFFLFAVTIPGILIAMSTLVISYRRLQRNKIIPAFSGAVGPISGRHSVKPDGRPLANGLSPPSATENGFLVVHASQTGTAEILANKTADSIRAAGNPVVVRDLADVQEGDLSHVTTAMFVISTTGDGDPPDRSQAFKRRVMPKRVQLSGLRYGLLALGDRQYSSYCSFADSVDSWLSSAGAQRIFDSVYVNDRDPAALTRWGRKLGEVTGRVDDFTLNEVPFRPWRLVERRHLNPSSAGGAAYHLRLQAEEGFASWEAGDIAQILAGMTWNDFRTEPKGLIQREFSIANTTKSGIDLLIRQIRHPDGRTGVASGFLTERIQMGESIPLRIRSNPSFHAPEDDRQMILIANGTGIAGVRAHLQRRIGLGHRGNWVVFGERNEAHDLFYAEELRSWKQDGHIERLDLVFSRDQEQRRYVQDRISECSADVLAWVERGAAIYVCGSLRGMAPAVNERLATILGEDRLDELARCGRYRRDVY